MCNIRKLIFFLLALGLSTSLVWSADDLISSQLVDEARQWQKRDRDDIAADLWRKLLRADPTHPVALAQLGLIEARAGNIKEAEALYNRSGKEARSTAAMHELAAALSAAQGKASGLPIPLTRQERAKPAVQVTTTTPTKRVDPKPTGGVASLQKTQPLQALPASSTRPTGKSGTDVDSDNLHLKFSTSIDPVR